MPASAEPQWHTATRCNTANCVEVAFLPDGKVGMRDSKNRDSQFLTFTTSQWETFLQRAKDGQFNLGH